MNTLVDIRLLDINPLSSFQRINFKLTLEIFSEKDIIKLVLKKG
jgi:hypothetical protein